MDSGRGGLDGISTGIASSLDMSRANGDELWVSSPSSEVGQAAANSSIGAVSIATGEMVACDFRAGEGNFGIEKDRYDCRDTGRLASMGVKVRVVMLESEG